MIRYCMEKLHGSFGNRIMDERTGLWSRDPSALVGQQLLTNYVFGHPSSTMVFLPTSSAIVFVNHADKPNAKLRWADSSHGGHANADWMGAPPKEMVESDKYYTVGLLMELVALRDVEPGEEVTIDYGEGWKRAWDAHQKSWRETAPANWPLRAVDLNARHVTAALPTELELEEVKDESLSYPDDVSLKAFLMINEADGKGEGTEQNPYQYAAPDDFSQLGTSTLFDVEVLDRFSSAEPSASGASIGVESYTYTVRVEYEDETSFVAGVPHHAFVFVDDVESGDQFAVDVKPFRHYIGIPDDVFPQGPWRNKLS
jgi:SET domain